MRDLPKRIGDLEGAARELERALLEGTGDDVERAYDCLFTLVDTERGR